MGTALKIRQAPDQSPGYVQPVQPVQPVPDDFIQ